MEAKIVQYIEYMAGNNYQLAIKLIQELRSLLNQLEEQYENKLCK